MSFSRFELPTLIIDDDDNDTNDNVDSIDSVDTVDSSDTIITVDSSDTIITVDVVESIEPVSRPIGPIQYETYKQNWMRYSGCKNSCLKHIQSYLVSTLSKLIDKPNIVIAEPCCGTATLSLAVLHLLRLNNYNGIITVCLNDINTNMTALIKKLVDGDSQGIINDAWYIEQMTNYRSGVKSSPSEKHRNQFTQSIESGNRLNNLNETHDLLSTAKIIITNNSTSDFMKSIREVDLMMFDPPYLRKLVKYKVDEYCEDQYINDVDYISTHFTNFMIFNDDKATGMKCHENHNQISYLIKTGGKHAMQRTETIHHNRSELAEQTETIDITEPTETIDITEPTETIEVVEPIDVVDDVEPTETNHNTEEKEKIIP